jgi:hypothetical protein
MNVHRFPLTISTRCHTSYDRDDVHTSRVAEAIRKVTEHLQENLDLPGSSISNRHAISIRHSPLTLGRREIPPSGAGRREGDELLVVVEGFPVVIGTQLGILVLHGRRLARGPVVPNVFCTCRDVGRALTMLLLIERTEP